MSIKIFASVETFDINQGTPYAPIAYAPFSNRVAAIETGEGAWDEKIEKRAYYSSMHTTRVVKVSYELHIPLASKRVHTNTLVRARNIYPS